MKNQFKMFHKTFLSPIQNNSEQISKGSKIMTLALGIVGFVIYKLTQAAHVSRSNNRNIDLNEFFAKSGIIQMALGFMMSSQTSLFVNDFVNGIVSPIVSKALGGDSGDDIKDLRVEILGVEFQFANMVVAVLRFTVTIVIVYALFIFLSAADVDLIHRK